MIRFITAHLDEQQIKYTVDKHGNIYAVKGHSATYPCVVAHTDEVHHRRGDGYEVVCFRNEIVFGYDRKHKHLTGIGADDKNGIWICLKCLEEFEVMKCAFFTGEEIGCIGSNRADMSFFDDCRFVLQCDRRGNSDFITSISGTHLCSDDFIRDVNPKSFGYKTEHGLQTDVMTLKHHGLDVSCVNISCGYYNPHTDEEYTRIADLKHCHRFVRHIIQSCTDKYPHKYQPRYRWPRSGYRRESFGYYGADMFDDDDSSLFGDKNIARIDTRLANSVRTSKHQVEYDCLLDDMLDLLAIDDTQSLDDLILSMQCKYPHLKHNDYQVAYNAIMG